MRPGAGTPPVRELLILCFMPLTHGINPRIVRRHVNSPKHPRSSAPGDSTNPSSYAVEEINSYIAIRDSLLTEAEADPTHATLQFACAANDFVESCLKPVRTPYEAQHLPEADAVRERKRCEAIKIRIAKLACVALSKYERECASAR